MATKSKPKFKTCTMCNKTKEFKDFYVSYHTKDGRDNICKECLKAEFEKYEDPKEGIIAVCKLVDLPFLDYIYESSLNTFQTDTREYSAVYQETASGKKKLIKNIPPGPTAGGLLPIYLKNIKQPQFRGLHFGEEYVPKAEKIEQIINQPIQEEIDFDDTANITTRDKEIEQDCIRLLEYDPFPEASPGDRRFLFNELINYLDEDTLNDGFKLSAVLEIVQSLNQLRKINIAINRIIGDSKTLANQASDLKTLVEMKQKLVSSVNAFAKENEISVKNRGSEKSQGKGTLTQLIKDLREKGIDEVKEDYFDVKTCEVMKQICDISNQSILAQINWDENEDKRIIQQQKELIKELEDKLLKTEEELRLAYVKLKEVEENE